MPASWHSRCPRILVTAAVAALVNPSASVSNEPLLAPTNSRPYTRLLSYAAPRPSQFDCSRK
ncbi:hypothetical protein PR001_g8935 [Phytophthora rubi]|uniref:RxLR effector protein n=1 Tax=Phytophthora rubi TaxID=129364 RepID=A0A6A3N3N8_9STRA|nr:hypothetical protein PR002_g16783 [Phytophthora rubi]KAE9036219.1 hypothetical protein PR001_g8935 [Phytophthora rubi]